LKDILKTYAVSWNWMENQTGLAFGKKIWCLSYDDTHEITSLRLCYNKILYI
jgi:hypothetical protein